jgi:hypothetical protein
MGRANVSKLGVGEKIKPPALEILRDMVYDAARNII